MTTQTLAGPKLKTALPGPNAKRILAGGDKYLSPSYTRSYPLVAKSGRGIVITDVDGNEFFYFSAGIAVCSTGHCHPHVVGAIQKQAGELIRALKRNGIAVVETRRRGKWIAILARHPEPESRDPVAKPLK